MAVARPQTVKVSNHDYLIAWGEIQTDTNEFLYGRTVPRLTVIQINDQVAKSQQRDTLLHELLHAAINETHLKFGEDAEEEVIRVMTPLLLQIIRENPKVVRWLREGAPSG